jgi:esterase/lipase superfamily enzyme
MSIYIISNRNVVQQKGVEVFQNKDHQATATFRIAKCDVDDQNSKVSYNILKDIAEPDYDKIIKVVDKQSPMSVLGGTELMFYDLYTSMSNDEKPNSDVLFFIHGFSTSHEDELEHILTLKRLYVDPEESPIEHIIYLSWPTSTHKCFTYWSDKEDSFITGQSLARLYIKLNKFFYTMFRKYERDNCGQKIHLMAHSMGNQVLKQTMGNLAEKYIVPFVGEIILLHADVAANSFEEHEPFAKLKKLGQRVHVYIHKSDDALTISTASKNFTKRLGKTGPTNVKQLEQDAFIVDVTGVKYDRVENDRFFTRLKNNLIDHWGYMYSSQQVKDIICVLRGNDERRIINRTRHDIHTNYFYLNTDMVVHKMN